MAASLRPVKLADARLMYSNRVAVSPQDFPRVRDPYVILNDNYVLTAVVWDQIPPGAIALNEDQRTWTQITLNDVIQTKLFDPFGDRRNRNVYLVSAEVDILFRSRKMTEEALDQEELENSVKKNFGNQIVSPGQRILTDWKGIPYLLVVKSITLGALGKEQAEPTEPTEAPYARGILTPDSSILFNAPASASGVKVKLKASIHAPARQVQLFRTKDFDFEKLGIGGLGKELGQIYTRAFSVHALPPAMREKWNVKPVKGLLLYGPPGTGKTLIARKIGQMLNAKEPKIVNGPEVLNKFVGQSEENIRKLFADAEAEYKEKGDESQLHLIIFDELDAICRQRGTSSGGGTGVGDNIVNQLLTKLDGVGELHNILLIGMTNRKDLIDEALLRPGRLEVHMRIPLPDEPGREQILKIHTQKLRENDSLAPDVDLAKIAAVTSNFSGAELAGLVRAAISYVAARHVNLENAGNKSMQSLSEAKVTQADFEQAAKEITPAFGVADDDFKSMKSGGIIHFSQNISDILEQGQTIIKQVRAGHKSSLYTMLLHGPPGTGKSALAAEIATSSGFPFVKLLSSGQMLGYNETSKLQHISKVMSDASDSPLSLVVLDDIEQIFDWIDEGPRFENATRKALNVILNRRPPEGKRLLIVATTSQRASLERLGMWESFRTKVFVPPVTQFQELGAILKSSGRFPDVNGAVRATQAATRTDSVNVGVKYVLYDMDAACVHPERQNEVFADAILRDTTPSQTLSFQEFN